MHQPQSHAREVWILLAPSTMSLFDLVVCLLVMLDTGPAGLAFSFVFSLI